MWTARKITKRGKDNKWQIEKNDNYRHQVGKQQGKEQKRQQRYRWNSTKMLESINNNNMDRKIITSIKITTTINTTPLAKFDLRLTGETDQGWTEEEKKDHEGPAGPRPSFHGFSLPQTTQFSYSCPSSLLIAVKTHFLVFYHWVFSWIRPPCSSWCFLPRTRVPIFKQ